MQFFDWCEERGLALHQIEPIAVSAYIEAHPGAAPTVKQLLQLREYVARRGFHLYGEYVDYATGTTGECEQGSYRHSPAF